MKVDPIAEEIRRYRREHGERFGSDPRKITGETEEVWRSSGFSSGQETCREDRKLARVFGGLHSRRSHVSTPSVATMR